MKKLFYLIVLSLLVLAGSTNAQGEDLELTIDILEPSEDPGKISPGIQYLEEKISRSPLKYQSYLELATAFRSIPPGEEARIVFRLRQSIKLVISPINITDKLVKFSLKLWSDGDLILDTKLSLIRQGTVMVGSPGDPNLIIAISEGF